MTDPRGHLDTPIFSALAAEMHGLKQRIMDQDMELQRLKLFHAAFCEATGITDTESIEPSMTLAHIQAIRKTAGSYTMKGALEYLRALQNP